MHSVQPIRTFFGVTFVVLALTTGAFAAVGEGEAAISGRYGKSIGDIPTEAFGPMRGFISGGYIVGVALMNGLSEMEMFSKSDQSDMSASQIETLLKANGAGEWKAEQTGKPNWRRWRREDGALVALYDTKRHFLYLSSKKFYEDKGKKIEEQEPPPNPER